MTALFECARNQGGETGKFMNFKKIFFITCGFVFLALGIIGTILPVMPTVPFLLAALLCFSKGSAKLHRWFMRTSIYKKYIESYTEARSMKPIMKFYSIAGTTVSVGIACWYLRKIPVLVFAALVIWLALVLYFLFGVKTLKNNDCQNRYSYMRKVLIEGEHDTKAVKTLSDVFEATGKIKSSLGKIPRVLILRMSEPIENEKLCELAEKAGFRLEQIINIENRTA